MKILILALLLVACNDRIDDPPSDKSFSQKCADVTGMLIHEKGGGYSCEKSEEDSKLRALCKEYGVPYKEIDNRKGCTIVG